MASYNAIMDSITNEDTADVELNAETIEGMSLADIEKAKNATLEGLSEEGQIILNQAYNDLKNNKISKAEYLQIVNGLVKMEHHPEEEITEADVNFLTYLEENAIGLGLEVTANTAKEVLTYFGDLNIAHASDFKVYSLGFSSSFAEKGRKLIGFGKMIGGAATAIGFSVGMYDDVANNKTGGEALAHNVSLVGIGAGVSILGKGIVTVALGSNPGGWAIAACVAGTVAITTGFEIAYQNNFLGIQDGLDTVGRIIDDIGVGEAIQNGIESLDKFGTTVKDKASEAATTVGEAIKSGIDTINPLNWGWGK
jgi:hypothetical protein